MRIIHLTTVHRPDDTRIYLKECRSLGAAGYDVTLVSQGQEGLPHDPTVRRVFLTRWKNRLGRAFLGSGEALLSLLRLRPDVVHFHDPELIPLGILARMCGCKVIYDVHEDVPKQILGKDWISPWARRPAATLMSCLERIGAYTFQHIVTATPAIARHFPQAKTSVVQNFPMKGELTTTSQSTPYAERPRQIAYVGVVSELRGIRQVVDAMALLPAENPCQLVIGGDFRPAALATEAQAKLGADRLRLLGWINRAQVADLLQTSRAGIVTFLPSPNHTDAQPNKLFEYMAAGLPVIASDFPLWREIIGQTGCGLLVNPEDPQAIAEAIQWVLNHPHEAAEMGKAGQQAIDERYHWDYEFSILNNVYRSVADEDLHDRGSSPAVRESRDGQPGVRRAA